MEEVTIIKAATLPDRWGKLVDRNAEILFFGCTLRSNTFLHGVEEWEEIPDRLDPNPQQVTVIGPHGEEYHTDIHRHNCLACEDVSQNYIKMEPEKMIGAFKDVIALDLQRQTVKAM